MQKKLRKRKLLVLVFLGLVIPLIVPQEVAATESTVTFEGRTWTSDYHPDGTTIKEEPGFGGRSTVLKFEKWPHYHAQVSRTIKNGGYLDHLEVSVDFYGDAVYSWSWAPVLKLHWPRDAINPGGFTAWIMKEASSYARWGVTGYTSPETYGMMYQDRWYTMKISVEYVLSYKTVITLQIRDVTNNGDWVTLYTAERGYHFVGDVEISLGTIRLDDYSYRGYPKDKYYYDNYYVYPAPVDPPPAPVQEEREAGGSNLIYPPGVPTELGEILVLADYAKDAANNRAIINYLEVQIIASSTIDPGINLPFYLEVRFKWNGGGYTQYLKFSGGTWIMHSDRVWTHTFDDVKNDVEDDVLTRTEFPLDSLCYQVVAWFHPGRTSPGIPLTTGMVYDPNSNAVRTFNNAYYNSGFRRIDGPY